MDIVNFLHFSFFFVAVPVVGRKPFSATESAVCQNLLQFLAGFRKNMHFVLN